MFVPFHGDGIISQFEGYEDLEELDWDAYRAQARQHPAARPDPARRGRGPRPLQARQAGRHGDAVLPVLGDDELKRAVRAARLPVSPMTRGARTSTTTTERTSHGSTLSFVAHAGVLAGVDPRELVGALPRRAGERRRRRPGRHDQGGHPHGRHVRDARPDPARLSRQPTSATASSTSSRGSPTGSTACRSRCSSAARRSA